MTNYAIARSNMVEGQLRPNKVTHEVLLDAMRTIPRELFVPKASRGIAYIDEDIAIGQGRYLTEPVVLARLLQEARVQPSDVILDIGCATGYSTAVLARLGSTVVAVDSDAELVDRAGELFDELGIENAVAIEANMAKGYPDQAPYDVILINGSVAAVPSHILDQLGDRGRLVAVEAPRGQMGTARLFQRIGETISNRAVFDAATPLLPGFEAEPSFVF